jgi:TRAP-type C4-dicarboxylate transport system permease small subunit
LLNVERQNNLRRFTYYTERILELISPWLSRIGGLAMLAMTLVLVANIIWRNITGLAFKITYESVQLIAIPMVSFSLIVATIKGRHIIVDILISRFSAKMQLILRCITSLIGLGILATLTWANIRYAGEMMIYGETTPVIELPVAPFRIIWTISLAIICFVLIVDIFQIIEMIRTKRWK